MHKLQENSAHVSEPQRTMSQRLTRKEIFALASSRSLAISLNLAAHRARESAGWPGDNHKHALSFA